MTQHLKPNGASDFREDSSGGMGMILTVVHVRPGSFYFFWVFPVEGNALWGPCSLFLILANKFHIGNTVYFLMEINFFGWIFCYGFLFSRSLCVPRLSFALAGFHSLTLTTECFFSASTTLRKLSLLVSVSSRTVLHV